MNRTCFIPGKYLLKVRSRRVEFPNRERTRGNSSRLSLSLLSPRAATPSVREHLQQTVQIRHVPPKTVLDMTCRVAIACRGEEAHAWQHRRSSHRLLLVRGARPQGHRLPSTANSDSARREPAAGGSSARWPLQGNRRGGRRAARAQKAQRGLGPSEPEDAEQYTRKSSHPPSRIAL